MCQHPIIETVWTPTSFGNMHALVGTPQHDLSEIPIVLVPGLGMSHRYMRPTLEILARKFTTYAVDFPGFGFSDSPAITLDVPDLTRALDEWLEVRNIPRAVFVANSFGCQITTQLAVTNSSRVVKLVLIAPTIDGRARSFRRQFFRLLHDGLLEPPSLILLAIREYLFTAGFWRAYQTFKFALADHIENRLPHVNAPTLVIRGARDPLAPETWCKQITQLIPNARFVTIPRAAHAVNYNSPEELVKAMMSFIQICE